MANADRNFGFLVNNAGLMVGYVDSNGVERDMAGNPIAAGARPATAGLARTVGQSAVAASVTGTTNETVLATIKIPGGAMGANGVMRIITLWTVTNSANNKQLRVRLGGDAGTPFLSLGVTTVAAAQELTLIRNRNSAASQVGFAATPASSYGTSTSANTTATVDTAADTSLVITGQLTNTGETITLEAYTVEILNP